MKNNVSSRNLLLTTVAASAALFIAWAEYVCWTNLNHDGFMWDAALALTFTAGMLWIATLSGKAEDFFLALISWW